MSESLWMFVGSVPEDGDQTLVSASDEAETMREGRRVSGYEDAEYDDSDFSAHLATAEEILGWSAALVNRKVHETAVGLPDSAFVQEGFLDTDDVRAFLSLKVKAAEARVVTAALSTGM